MDINYIGEHVFAGMVGRVSITLSCFSVLLAIVMYLMHTLKDHRPAFKLYARYAFVAHTLFLLTAFSSLYYLIFAHAFEYQYVWQYSSRDLPLEYLVSSLWAGQEGSFLVWAFFQALLGLLVLKRFRDWESPVMAIVALSQFFLMMMLLGWTLLGHSLGNDPFLLIRQAADNATNPFFQQPNYAQMITDGQGLNPLLENIWMAIHPPLLFLGYASVLIPFALAMAGLWKGDHQGWRTLALPWVNFAALCLGVGIILGGAWAYVSLTFGGFWAWDPVENASLVPWLFVIATLHVLLISRKKPQNYTWAYLFAALSYIFVLYASYLTRSGVLKDASAHAFGDADKAILLVLFNLVFVLVPLLLFIFKRPVLPERQKDKLSSKDFWVFVGAITLALSGFQIILTTSIPVFNKLFGTQFAPPTDSVAFYNAWQLPYAILISLLIGFTYYTRYGESPYPAYLKKTIPGLVIAFAVSLLFFFVYPFPNPLHYLFLFFLIFMLYATIEGFFQGSRNAKSLGSLVSHLGLGIFLLGVLITFAHAKTISSMGGQASRNAGDMAENQILTKGDTVNMPPYKVIYQERREAGKWLHYTLQFLKEKRGGEYREAFTLHPAINRNLNMGNVHEPATRHLLTKDIYGYITFAQQMDFDGIPGYSLVRKEEIGQGDSLRFKGSWLVMDSLEADMSDPSMNNLYIRAYLSATDSVKRQSLQLEYRIKDQRVVHVDDSVPTKGLVLRFMDVSSQGHKINLGIYEQSQDYIVMKVMVFPFIMVMWAGTIILFIGFILAMIARWRRTVNTGQKETPAGDNPSGDLP